MKEQHTSFRFRLLRFPKAPHRPIPIDSLPGGEYAKQYIEITGAAHAQEIKKATRKLMIAITCAALLVVASGTGIWYMLVRLNAPDHVIKTHEAQQRITYGPYYGALKSRHPEQPIIPPMDQWAPRQPKER